MQKYMLLAVGIRFLVDFMLLFAAKRLFSPYSGLLKPLIGAVFGAAYAAGCLLPGLSFLQENVWYIASILLSCLLSFGIDRAELSGAAVFCLLRLALDGLAIQGGCVLELVFGIVLSGLSLLGFGGSHHWKRYIPVELHYREKTVRLQALWDTGHDLRDPVTGKSVLVVGADIADSLTGLKIEQLRNPVETMGAVSGLRLIPYQTVEHAGKMMLGIMMPHTKIGKKKVACLVAFAPQVLDSNGKFQALIGGTV